MTKYKDMMPEQQVAYKAKNERWRQANLTQWKQRNKDNSRRYNYGITAEEYAALRKVQKNKCAICGRRETKRHRNGVLMSLSVDHDHKTKRVRGLLCDACNRGLGCFADNAIRLAAATCYIAGGI